MKKTIAKLLCTLLVLALLIPIAALPVSASDDGLFFVYCGEKSLLRFPVDDAYFPEKDGSHYTVNRFYSNPNSDVTFFSQLSSAQKRIYNALLNSRMGLDAPEFEQDGTVLGRRIDIPFSDFKLASTSYETLMSIIDKNVVFAISSLMEDYPEFFWVGGYGYGMALGYDIANGQYYLDTLVLILMANPYAYENWDSIEDDYNYLNAKVDEFVIEGNTRYEKLLSIHDSICEQADYDFTFVLPHAYDPLGIFVDPNDFVCEGYSEIFKLLCDREGIPCVCVVGEGGYGDNTGAHKWNYVQMEDGQWYGVDVTWDDQDETLHDYFLVGSESRSEAYFGHHMFSEEHVASGALFMGVRYRLSYPTLSKTGYYCQDGRPVSSDGLWRYQMLDDGTVSICSGVCDTKAYLGSAQDVTVPTEIDGYTVSELGTSAFAHCENVRSVTVPDSIKSIGRFSFEGSSVEQVVLPQGIKSIPFGAFSDCSLKEITVPDSVETIERQAFEKCDLLKTVVLPDAVTDIPDFAFSGCSSLTGIRLGESTASIGQSAFEGCKKLQSVDISGVSSIGPNAFAGCAALESITLSDTLTELKTKVFSECSALSDVTLPDSLESIGDAAFYKCVALEKIYIPAGVAEIPKSAFLKSGLKEIYGYHGTGAETYSSAYGISFIPLDDYDCEAGIHCYKSHRSPDETVYECLLCSDSYTEPLPELSVDGSVTVNADIDCKDENQIYYICFEPDNDGLYEFSFEGTDVSFEVVNGKDTVSPSQDNRYRLEKGVDCLILVGLNDADGGSFTVTAKYKEEPKEYSFPDVQKDAWYYEAVQYNASHGYITGFKNGTFGPDKQLTRQDFVVILARIAGADLSSYENVQSKMSDVAKGSYYAAAVNWAVANNIIKGYNNGKFGVGDPITREQVCVILYRYMNSPAVTGADKTLKPFADAGKISSFAKDAVVWAIQNGVISGKKADTLAPTVTASRAEIATIVMRMDKAGMFE